VTFTEYQVNHVLFPKYMHLDRDVAAFRMWARETFPTAPKEDIEVLVSLFDTRAPRSALYGGHEIVPHGVQLAFVLLIVLAFLVSLFIGP